MSVIDSARHHARLGPIWADAESRHLTEDELSTYMDAMPDWSGRAYAAREVKQHEAAVVKAVVQQVFVSFPYEANHELASAKCTRDVRYVSAYATMAMLMNDPQWLDDKLLIWMKTILLSFEFPDRAQKRSVLFAKKSTDLRTDSLDAKRRSIYDCYTRLRDGYRQVLTPSSWELMQPILQQVVDSLTEA